jgi:protein-S-isoprenylcysteine O-methyltransferase Ste14
LVSIAAQTSPGRHRLELGLDIAEKLLVFAVFGRLAWAMWTAVSAGATWLNYLQLANEGVVVVLVLMRRPAREVSFNPTDWALALGATVGPFLIRPVAGVAPIGPPVIAGVLMIGGLVLQLYAKLTLRRSFGVVPANRGLVIAGPYQLVRHPIYLAYGLAQIGFLLIDPTWWNLAVYVVSIGLQVRRIQAEEDLLAKDPAFSVYVGAVRFRLIPGIW